GATGSDDALKNTIARLPSRFPLPVPQRWRRRLMSLGSGHPTRIICSALIAQAFESVRYPILPKVTVLDSKAARREILEIRHSSLYAPRDFDISPYFTVVKPTIECGFDYRAVHWADLPIPPAEVAEGEDPFQDAAQTQAPTAPPLVPEIEVESTEITVRRMRRRVSMR